MLLKSESDSNSNRRQGIPRYETIRRSSVSMDRICAGFAFWSSVGLFVFGAMVVWTTFGAGPILSGPDPVFSISSAFVLYGISGGSFAVSAFLLLAEPKHITVKLYLLAWFSFTLIVYQLGAVWDGGANFLGCLGNLNDKIPVPPKVLLPIILVGTVTLFLVDILLIFLSRVAAHRQSTYGKPVVEQNPKPLAC